MIRFVFSKKLREISLGAMQRLEKMRMLSLESLVVA